MLEMTRTINELRIAHKRRDFAIAIKDKKMET